ncbi:Lysophospholipase, alpha-beta hydrolase superfamily [Cellulosimicrobium aquatile]|uniref:Lysophospholipase, alpha-beta hydrolase superfamily n=1 Tax=Cellulosimicrobium aquatile TaxID=1612203 RepID=A0A1N6NK07_9MICO|nr:alpha/beta hydrolase [Cellulosimicrobium aquatile]SIP92415.1 Lysophospholipase, alpha-beta hydrolase superfamily [Cellulosimicrobium aquatile]
MDEATWTDGTWRPDVLGGDWVARDLDLPDGAVATLVRRDAAAPAGDRPAVLYVHGFIDYFFQTHVAEAVEARGYRFYAVDLRGYGRSIGRGSGAPSRPDDDPNFVTDLAVYAQDLDAAARAVRAEGHDRLVVLGHSTGGLLASLWADARPGRLAALVLNSPWFDLNKPWVFRGPVTWVVDVVGRVAPRLVVGALDPHWAEALHASTGGEWDFDLAWKPIEGFPVRAGFLRAVRRGHARVARGLHVDCPVLVLASARSGPASGWHDALLTTDSVLDVGHITSRAERLGDDVTVVTVEGGAHDLALSPEPARSAYLREVLDWLDARV